MLAFKEFLAISMMYIVLNYACDKVEVGQIRAYAGLYFVSRRQEQASYILCSCHRLQTNLGNIPEYVNDTTNKGERVNCRGGNMFSLLFLDFPV